MNYNNYLNKESGKQDIYTKNSLLKMTLQDIIDKEMELSYQYNTIGIPADEDMYASPYVRQYTAESGLPMWTSATDVINNLQSLRQFASQPNFFPKGLKSTQEMIEEERQKRLLRQQQNSEMDLDTTQADDMMKPLEVNPDANALNMEPEEQINPFENWSTKSQPVQQTSNTNSLVGNIGNLANKLSQKFGNPMEKKLGLKVPEEESITPNTRVGIAQEMNVPIEDRGIVPQNKTPKKGGIAPLQEQKYTLRTDPMWDDMKREMLDPNIAAQKKLQEARELDAFNQAWDRIHGVKNEKRISKDENITGLATDVNKKIIENWDKNGKVYYTYEDGKKVPDKIKQKLPNKLNIRINKKPDDENITPTERAIDTLLKGEAVKSKYPVAADFYIDARENFSRAKTNPNAKILENISSLDKASQEQLKKYGVKDTDRGVLYDKDSNVAELFANSPEVRQFLIENKDAIKKGEVKDGNLDFEATFGDAFFKNKKFDRLNSIQHGKLYNIKYNDDGTFSASLGDRLDYHKRKPSGIFDFKTFFNNFGYSMQEKGNLENYFTQIDMKVRDKLPNETMKEYLEEIEDKKRKKKSRRK